MYSIACCCENSSHVPRCSWKLVIHQFCYVCAAAYVKVHMCIDLWDHSYCSKNFWSPFIRSEICWALLRLKKGFFGGSSGSCNLQKTQMHPIKWQEPQCRFKLKVCVLFLLKLPGQNTVKYTYISCEFACSFCLSHTNSLYLLLTLEFFLVKHTLSV